MRQILLALVVLSTFAFAQNVLAISPAPRDLANATPVASTAKTAGRPPVGSLALLFAGLVGLSAAGRRFEGRSAA
ncbi:MAG: hypothetical protein NXI30_10950 [bacterium]|nr:hypothetical protein [bacterium]